MGSHCDRTDGTDDPQQRRIYVPEGPLLDAWSAPEGGAVKLSILATQRQARWLRRARPRPFGFAPGSEHPALERIGDAHGAGTLSSGIAGLLGLRTPVHTMSISYGDPTQSSAPGSEIISDFHRDYQDRDLEEALLEAAATWAGDRWIGGSRPEVTSATIDVVVSARRRSVSMLQLGDFSAFQVVEDRVLVTVLARHMRPQFPDIVRLRIADLEPMISAMEHPDREAVAAAFAEFRRQHIEQMRNQAPPSS